MLLWCLTLIFLALVVLFTYSLIKTASDADDYEMKLFEEYMAKNDRKYSDK